MFSYRTREDSKGSRRSKVLIEGKTSFVGCYMFNSCSQGQTLCLSRVQWAFTLFTFERLLFGAGVGLDCLQQTKAHPRSPSSLPLKTTHSWWTIKGHKNTWKKNDILESSEATIKIYRMYQNLSSLAGSKEFLEENYEDKAWKMSQGQLLNALAFRTKAIRPPHTLCAPAVGTETVFQTSSLTVTYRDGSRGVCPRTLKGVSGKSLINHFQGEIGNLFLLNHARVGGGGTYSCTRRAR